jgi:hypothetical protein
MRQAARSRGRWAVRKSATEVGHRPPTRSTTSVTTLNRPSRAARPKPAAVCAISGGLPCRSRRRRPARRSNPARPATPNRHGSDDRARVWSGSGSAVAGSCLWHRRPFRTPSGRQGVRLSPIQVRWARSGYRWRATSGISPTCRGTGWGSLGAHRETHLTDRPAPPFHAHPACGPGSPSQERYSSCHDSPGSET